MSCLRSDPYNARYASCASPLLLRACSDGLIRGGSAIASIARGNVPSEFQTPFVPSERGLHMVQSVFEMAEAGKIEYVPSSVVSTLELFEALRWPRDSESGARFGFPDRSLFDSGADAVEVTAYATHLLCNATKGESIPSIHHHSLPLFHRSGRARRSGSNNHLSTTLWTGSYLLRRSFHQCCEQGLKESAIDMFSEDEMGLNITSAGELKDMIGMTAAQRVETAVLFVGASWCRKCKELLPAYKSFAQKVGEERPGVRFLMLDAGRLSSVAKTLNVSDVPEIVVFRGGKRIPAWLNTKSINLMEMSILKAL